MTKDEAKKIARMIESIYPRWDLPPDGRAFWLESLMEIDKPFEKVEKAAKVYLQCRDDQFAPALGEFLTDLERSLHDPFARMVKRDD